MSFKPADIASFLHFGFLLAILCLMARLFDYYILEMSIVIILMYEIGFKIDFVDDLIEMNSSVTKVINKFCKDHLPSPKRRNRRKK